MSKSLLQQAKEIHVKGAKPSCITNDEIELALAWLADEVAIVAIAKVMNYKTPGNTLNRLAQILREAYRRGFIEINSEKINERLE